MSVRAPVEAQEAARLLLEAGRWWHDLDADLIAWGTRALINSPAYRESVYKSAYAYAQVMNLGLLAASLTDARDVLALNDTEEAE